MQRITLNGSNLKCAQRIPLEKKTKNRLIQQREFLYDDTIGEL